MAIKNKIEGGVLARIESFHAAISADEKGEGLIGMMRPDGTWVPLIAADPERLAFIVENAKALAEARGIRVTIAKFSAREDIEVLDGRH